MLRPGAMAEIREVGLPTGRLDVAVERAAWPLDELCDFAARDNPRRGFLIVSRVLGRHLPARPASMRRSVRDLASMVSRDLPGPVTVVGLAETAVCLGQTLHEELRRRWNREDVLFIHSTRQRMPGDLLCRFEEPHSHASAHLVYEPRIADFSASRTLVLVDDEVSTGTTLTNLARALTAKWPRIERIVVATLTDWSLGSDWPRRMPAPCEVVSLLSGGLSWTPSGSIATPPSFEAATAALGRLREDVGGGRFGIRAPSNPSPVSVTSGEGGPLRLVGTGEFTYAPFRLAERLEEAGADVVVQATSRSPARLGAAMGGRLVFEDNYGTGVANYLYNADPLDGRRTLICCETPAAAVDPALVRALDAEVVTWAR